MRLRSIDRPLGYTRRDQLIQEAIDDYLTNEKMETADERRDHRAKVIKDVQQIWRRVEEYRDFAGAGPQEPS